MDRILLTGVTGFVGSHMADHILDNHPDVKVFGIKRWRSSMDNIEHIKNKLYLFDGDLKDLSFVIYALQSIKPDAIIHLAAQSLVPYSYTNPTETINDNVIGTLNLLEAIRINGINPYCHIVSSSEVYGQVRKEDIPIKEDCPLRPVSPYAVAKVAEDMLAYSYFVAYKLNIVRTRMFTHTGARQSDALVTSDFARQIAEIEIGKRKPIIEVGNLDSVRTFADIKDTVRAYWMLMEKFFEGKIPAGEVYNIGGNVTMTIREMLSELLALSPIGKTVEIKIAPHRLRPADVTLQIPNSDRFMKATGWKPEVPFEQTLSDLLSYWRERVK